MTVEPSLTDAQTAASVTRTSARKLSQSSEQPMKRCHHHTATGNDHSRKWLWHTQRRKLKRFFEQQQRLDQHELRQQRRGIGPKHAGAKLRKAVNGSVGTNDMMRSLRTAVVANHERRSIVPLNPGIDEAAFAFVAKAQSAQDRGARRTLCHDGDLERETLFLLHQLALRFEQELVRLVQLACPGANLRRQTLALAGFVFEHLFVLVLHQRFVGHIALNL